MDAKELMLNFNEPSREWSVCKSKTFSVLVRAWPRSSGQWGWNVYAIIFDDHPLHKNVDGALSLPFHGGPTLDIRVVATQAQGLKYNWQRVSDVLKVGSDYMHAYDEWAEKSDPADGIPIQIQSDARELVAALAAAGA